MKDLLTGFRTSQNLRLGRKIGFARKDGKLPATR